MTETSKSGTKWQDEAALSRYQLISPLLDESLDDAARIRRRKDIAEQEGISERTLRRYESAYRSGGFEGLKPADRTGSTSSRLPSDYDSLLEQAVQLKREVPQRSVNQIICILEMEGRVAPGVLKRSTLERHLYEAGFGVRQMQMYNDARESSSKRFCKPHRMMLVQADIKYGPKLPIGKNGARVQTYLSSVLDDHSRYVLQSEFYASQDEEVVEDTFHKAVIKWGKFDKAYLDNGSQYIARQLRLSLSRLGISIAHAPVKSGKSKGKIEIFHQTVDAFLREAAVHNIKTLEDLNHYWQIFLEEYYHKRPHDGIREYYESQGVSVPAEGISPEQEWNRDTRALTFLDTSVVSEAFLHHEERRVDKGACVSFRGRKYETKPSLIGCMVEIAFDPMDTSTITVSYRDMEPFKASPVKIGSYCDKSPALPASMQTEETTSSRMLKALEKRHEENNELKANAISYKDYRKDGDCHV